MAETKDMQAVEPEEAAAQPEKKPENLHIGHRERLRQRFAREGLEGFADHEVLELILFHAISRRDVDPIARALLQRFGSLRAVLEASPRELKQVEGVGGETADLLSLLLPVMRRYLKDQLRFDRLLNTTEKIGQYLVPYFLGERDEVVYMLCLDGKLMVKDCRMMFRGNVNAAPILVRTLAENALNCKASYVVLAHNHPAGIALPSREDEQTTLLVRKALGALDIQLIDHIIVAGEDFVSMAQSGFPFIEP